MAKKPIVTKNITASQFLFSKIAITTAILYVLLLLLLHLLEPEFEPTWRFISEYELGKSGILMNACFLLYSVAVICTILVTLPHTKTIPGYIGLVILAVSAFGIAMAGIFNTDPITTDMSQISYSGKMHYTGASLDYAPVGFLLLALALGRNKAWRPIRAKLLLTSVISILLTIAMIASMPSDYKFNSETYTGLIGRFMFSSYLLSILVIGFYAQKLYKVQKQNHQAESTKNYNHNFELLSTQH